MSTLVDILDLLITMANITKINVKSLVTSLLKLPYIRYFCQQNPSFINHNIALVGINQQKLLSDLYKSF